MKRIAFISELYGSKVQGGENIAMFRLAKEVQKLGFAVDFFSYTGVGREKIYSFIPFKLRSLPFVRDIIIVPFIGKKFFTNNDYNFEVFIFSSTTLACFYRPKSKLINIIHNIRSQKFETFKNIPKYKLLFNPLTYYVISFLEQKSFKNCAKLIVIRDHQKDFLISKFKISPNKVEVIPNGINTNVFKPKKLKKKNQVIFVGRATVPKGFDTLLEAKKSIKGDLLIVTQKVDLELIDKAKRIPNIKIIYNASQEELSTYYSESNVFVLPSLDEEQPLTTMEAMACGLPVVVTPKAGSDIVKDRKNGYVIPISDPDSLSKACNRLLQNKDIAFIMGSRNRDLITKKYSITEVAKRITKTI